MIDITTVFLSFLIFIFVSPLIKLLRFTWKIIINSEPIDLKQKFGEWAVVTGSSAGIGKEYAKQLAIRNINVVLISKPLDELEAAKNEISSLNPNIQVKIIQADFSTVKDATEKIEKELKDIPIGILVNNVGMCQEYPMHLGQMSKSIMSDMLNVNVGAATLMTHLIIEQMKKRRKGAIVNLCSASDAFPVPLLSVYAAGKTFIHYLSDAIRVEYAEYGITIQTLSPYYITTALTAYNLSIQGHPLLFPDAATYARNAIKTLGKLDTTTGYWVHEIIHAYCLLWPVWLVVKVCFYLTGFDRDNYLKSKGKKVL